MARYAEDKGVTLALEPLNRFETSFINLTEQALELMRMIDSPRVKLMMDTFHANIEEKSLGKAIEAAGQNLVHVHANENDRGTPGTGHVAWNEIAAALKKVKFDGALVIESFSTEVKEIARAAAVWRPLAPSAGRPGHRRPGLPEKAHGLEAEERRRRCRDQSPFSPASGPTCPWRRWRRRPARWGFDGLELACWGDHFDVEQGAGEGLLREGEAGPAGEEQAEVLRHQQRTWSASALPTTRSTSATRRILPPRLWGDGKPEGVRQRCAEEMKNTAKAAKLFGVNVVNGFTGSPRVGDAVLLPADQPGDDRRGLQGFRRALDAHPGRVQEGRA